MNSYPNHPAAQPFFLNAMPGKRFCIYHAPNPVKECQGGMIYIHPFGDEMNRAKRMAALQARAFSKMGFAVLQLDLYGCGDSDGEFRGARWEIWMEDLAAAKKWLEARIFTPIGLWGLRLGALLALDFARSSGSAFDTIILWQPVISGKSFLTQFLRLRLANDILKQERKESGSAHALRNMLAAGDVLEVAGYEIAPALTTTIDTLDAAELVELKSSVHWFEIVPEPGGTMAPARAKVAGTWVRNEVNLHVHHVEGIPFWSTQEVSECPQLLSAMTSLFA